MITLFSLFFIIFVLFSSLLLCIFGVNYPKNLPSSSNFIKTEAVIPKLMPNNFVLAIDSPSIYDNNLPAINNSNTFSANGVFSSVLFPNYDVLLHNVNKSSTSSETDSLSRNENAVNVSLYEFPKIVSGSWILNVTQGNVTNFYGFFKLITSDGLEKHFIEMNNFKNTNLSIVLNPYTTTIINGYVDFRIDNQLFESNLPIKIQLNKINTISVYITKQTVSDLLFDNPIHGVVNSFKNFRNDELLVLDNR